MTVTIDLSGRRALVTGGGQGVGRAICHSFAAAGATVYVNDFVPERAQSVTDEIRTAGGRAEALPFDVSDYGAATEAIGSTPGIDILVNNAGNAGPLGFVPKPLAGGAATATSVALPMFAESDPSDWDRYFAVNLYGVMYCTRAALPHMIESGEGRIVTIVSEAGRWGEPRMAAYSAAKAAAAGFSRALAREVGRSGITVNNVALATIDTLGLAARAAKSEEMAQRVERQLGRYIIRRLGQPDDVAGLVTFLASSLAAWITGQTYPVNGGYTVNL